MHGTCELQRVKHETFAVHRIVGLFYAGLRLVLNTISLLWFFQVILRPDLNLVSLTMDLTRLSLINNLLSIAHFAFIQFQSLLVSVTLETWRLQLLPIRLCSLCCVSYEGDIHTF